MTVGRGSESYECHCVKSNTRKADVTPKKILRRGDITGINNLINISIKDEIPQRKNNRYQSSQNHCGCSLGKVIQGINVLDDWEKLLDENCKRMGYSYYHRYSEAVQIYNYGFIFNKYSPEPNFLTQISYDLF